jgi:glycopeptide antibiotics resistance protein
MKHRFSSWIVVALVIIALTYVALGHRGFTNPTHSLFRLIPFEEYGRMIRCTVTNCPSLAQAHVFLLRNGLGNIVVFMPLGTSLFITLNRSHNAPQKSAILTATIIGIVVSTLYEIIQIWIPGRVVATDDVILNAAGTALGAVLGSVMLSFHNAMLHTPIVLDENGGTTTT